MVSLVAQCQGSRPCAISKNVLNMEFIVNENVKVKVSKYRFNFTKIALNFERYQGYLPMQNCIFGHSLTMSCENRRRRFLK
jgi:hypothetical protein